MRVLIAPDCFGDSLTAVEAAESIAAGWAATGYALGRRAERAEAAPPGERAAA